MLDKSIPYFNVIMKRLADIPIPAYSLTQGYSFTWFYGGQEKKWAEIVTSVGEFEHAGEALEYFREKYMPFAEELERRLLFVINEDWEEVGTITSWWDLSGVRRVPSIHWFAVKPEYQGLGLGKALVSECLVRLLQLEGNKDIFLHTQTWSYKAIKLYMNAGFRIEPTEVFASYKNDYREAIPILERFIPLEARSDGSQ
jgi:GNAT superfamily N-acetyltransferase